MKTTACIASLILTVLLAAVCRAATYNDATGDFTGNSALDITSVVLNNDATTLSFTINVAGDPTTANWYNYYVGISRNLFGGVGGNLNGPGGWGKNIQMSVGGMNYFIGAYPFWGGYSLLTWNGSAWTTTTGSASQTTSSVSFSVGLLSLGLSLGETFRFDVWTSTSGGDTVLDALSDTVTRTWNSAPFDTANNFLTYTVVPEPGPAALLGLSAVLQLLRRARRSRRTQD
ncbi:MAG: hypothetical protein RMK20_01900 [Verrucomicrobiales bacterium]|nr:hypothetical protein [Verrucomicrobiales bacterium]